MALKATVFKLQLQVNDIDRGYYQQHSLTLARHPSETDERMMLRVLAFALFADERLAFTRGLSSTDEPDLWLLDATDHIQLWLELGQPDSKRLRKACGRADRVVVISYGGRGAEQWWRQSGELQGLGNLSVINIDPAQSAALAALAQRGMQIDVTISEGEVMVVDADTALQITPHYWQRADA